jgi:hypothetical protein
MNLEDLVHALAAIERALHTRVAVWRIVLDGNSKEIGRLYRGSFNAPRDSSISEPQQRHERFE